MAETQVFSSYFLQTCNWLSKEKHNLWFLTWRDSRSSILQTNLLSLSSSKLRVIGVFGGTTSSSKSKLDADVEKNYSKILYP
jgi:hypothetical protein